MLPQLHVKASAAAAAPPYYFLWCDAFAAVDFEKITLPLLLAPEDDYKRYYAAMRRLHCRKASELERMNILYADARRSYRDGLFVGAVEALQHACLLRRDVFLSSDYQVSAAYEHAIWAAIHLALMRAAEEGDAPSDAEDDNGDEESDDDEAKRREKLRKVDTKNPYETPRLFAIADHLLRSTSQRSPKAADDVVVLPHKILLEFVLRHNWANYWVRRKKWNAALKCVSIAEARFRQLWASGKVRDGGVGTSAVSLTSSAACLLRLRSEFIALRSRFVAGNGLSAGQSLLFKKPIRHDKESIQKCANGLLVDPTRDLVDSPLAVSKLLPSAFCCAAGSQEDAVASVESWLMLRGAQREHVDRETISGDYPFLEPFPEGVPLGQFADDLKRDAEFQKAAQERQALLADPAKNADAIRRAEERMGDRARELARKRSPLRDYPFLEPFPEGVPLGQFADDLKRDAEFQKAAQERQSLLADPAKNADAIRRAEGAMSTRARQLCDGYAADQSLLHLQAWSAPIGAEDGVWVDLNLCFLSAFDEASAPSCWSPHRDVIPFMYHYTAAVIRSGERRFSEALEHLTICCGAVQSAGREGPAVVPGAEGREVAGRAPAGVVCNAHWWEQGVLGLRQACAEGPNNDHWQHFEETRRQVRNPVEMVRQRVMLEFVAAQKARKRRLLAQRHARRRMLEDEHGDETIVDAVDASTGRPAWEIAPSTIEQRSIVGDASAGSAVLQSWGHFRSPTRDQSRNEFSVASSSSPPPMLRDVASEVVRVKRDKSKSRSRCSAASAEGPSTDLFERVHHMQTAYLLHKIEMEKRAAAGNDADAPLPAPSGGFGFASVQRSNSASGISASILAPSSEGVDSNELSRKKSLFELQQGGSRRRKSSIHHKAPLSLLALSSPSREKRELLKQDAVDADFDRTPLRIEVELPASDEDETGDTTVHAEFPAASRRGRQAQFRIDLERGAVVGKKRFNYAPHAQTIPQKQTALRALLPNIDAREQSALYRSIVAELAENEEILHQRRTELQQRILKHDAERLLRIASLK